MAVLGCRLLVLVMIITIIISPIPSWSALLIKVNTCTGSKTFKIRLQVLT